jgi:hypothetical protein
MGEAKSWPAQHVDDKLDDGVRFYSLPSVVSWVEASRTARGQYTGEAGGGLGLVASEVLRGIVSEAGRRVAAGMVPAGSGESASGSSMSNAKLNEEAVGDVSDKVEDKATVMHEAGKSFLLERMYSAESERDKAEKRFDSNRAWGFRWKGLGFRV